MKILAEKKVRHPFASKIANLFKQLPDYTEDIETE